MTFCIFVSSVQKELKAERAAVRNFVREDPLLRRYFDVFLFEDLPAGDRAADEMYLAKVDECAVFLGLFANDYGYEDSQGVSPTEREFDRATARGKCRLIFVKGQDDSSRHPKMQALIRKAARQVIRRRYSELSELIAGLYASLVEFLAERGVIDNRPFDARACRGASLRDISEEKLRWFLQMARAERHYPLGEKTPARKALTHLNLLDRGQPTCGGILLFGESPQKFLPTSEVKCLHFHGTEVRKPIPSYHIYKGTAFELVDQALDFVLGTLARRVEASEGSAQARRSYEIPRSVIREALVNAVAHRDYTSNASVQVMVFVDRVEVWNPGRLPPDLTPELLRHEHASIPANPLICDPLFLAHYAEKAGTGTLDMIGLCRGAGLPEPDYEQRGGQFVVTIWRDWLTTEVIARLDLNSRQMAVIGLTRQQRRITAGEYQKLAGTSRATAKRDLEELVAKGLIVPAGAGRGAFYAFAKERLINGSNGSSAPVITNGSQTAQSAHAPPTRKPPKGATQGPNGPSLRPEANRNRAANEPNVPRPKPPASARPSASSKKRPSQPRNRKQK